MIKTPTVFVLGAGASAPYGFPLGGNLARYVCRNMGANGPLQQILLGYCPRDLVGAFADEFARSGQYSLDAFAERRWEFRDLVKMAIVHSLAPCENEEVLLAPPHTDEHGEAVSDHAGGRDRDWCRYLVSKIVTTHPDDFGANNLKVITFNFDRSFERRLFIALKAAYSRSDAAIEDLVAKVPVMHLHGDLGVPNWLPSQVGTEFARGYVSDDLTNELHLYAQRLSLIDDEIPKERIEEARQWVSDAKNVCFIGFGYHPLNMRRLGVETWNSGLQVRGTARGLSRGELGAVEREFRRIGNVHLFQEEQWDTLQFLRETDFVHE